MFIDLRERETDWLPPVCTLTGTEPSTYVPWLEIERTTFWCAGQSAEPREQGLLPVPDFHAPFAHRCYLMSDAVVYHHNCHLLHRDTECLLTATFYLKTHIKAPLTFSSPSSTISTTLFPSQINLSSRNNFLKSSSLFLS